MKVWNTGVHTRSIDFYSKAKDPLMEKVIFWAPFFLTAMGKYFSERSYGERVKEIFYREFCLKEGYKDKLLYYGSRRKIVDCAIVLDYEAVLKMGIEEYGKYLAKLYIERSNQFTELKVKDFDVGKYVEDLESFFKLNKLL
ncbi:MAG: hypothetical protein IPI78_19315 [Chitinophagaceae bacterium]|nr:hypothetical protein [Chitinophagaceae bacterium]